MRIRPKANWWRTEKANKDTSRGNKRAVSRSTLINHATVKRDAGRRSASRNTPRIDLAIAESVLIPNYPAGCIVPFAVEAMDDVTLSVGLHGAQEPHEEQQGHEHRTTRTHKRYLLKKEALM